VQSAEGEKTRIITALHWQPKPKAIISMSNLFYL
jgi:hypothetical protein